MTRMRIVQWENQPERGLSAGNVLQQLGCEHIVVGSAEAFRSSLESGSSCFGTGLRVGSR